MWKGGTRRVCEVWCRWRKVWGDLTSKINAEKMYVKNVLTNYTFV